MRVFTNHLLITVWLLAWSSPVFAQSRPESEISAMVTRMIGGKASAGGGSVTYDNGTGYQVILGQLVETHVLVEGSYLLFPTEGHFNPPGGSALLPTTKEMTIHYFQFGAAYHAMTENIQPFISTAFGLVWFRPRNTSVTGDWRMAISGGVGVKVFPSPNIGLRFETRVFAPVYFSRGGFWSSVIGGDARFRPLFPIVQADIAAGITIAY